MGEHTTWYDFLYDLPGFQNLSSSMKYQLGRDVAADKHGWKFMMFGDTHWTLSHVLGALTVALFVIYGGYRFRAAVMRGGRDAIVPPAKFGLRNIFELITEAIFSVMESVMGKKNAERFLPFIGSLGFFIFFSNLMSLIPGFAPPTDSLKTNVALALLVFFATHYFGVKEHGLAYFKHFLGPVWWLSWLMLPVELMSHIARPASLSLRLMGNMASDHKLVATLFVLVPVLVPVPFLVLGILVSIVQTMVFCLLSMVYIQMAIAHDHGDEHAEHAQHAHGH